MNLVHIDWLSFTMDYSDDLRAGNLSQLMLPWLPHESAEETGSVKGYSNGMDYAYYRAYWNPKVERNKVYFVMSGEECELAYEAGIDVFQVACEAAAAGANITRIDIAFDDFEKALPLEKIADEVTAKRYVSHLTKYNVMRSENNGLTVYIGSRQSKKFIRFYDKSAETIAKTGKKAKYDSWTRCEIVLRDEYAMAFVQTYPDDYSGFIAVLSRNVRFVIPQLNDYQCVTRWPMQDWWEAFLESYAKGKFCSVGLNLKPSFYNFNKLRSYVFDQAGSSIVALLQFMGEEALLEEIRKRSPSRKHLSLMAKMKEHLKQLEEYDPEQMSFYELYNNIDNEVGVYAW